MTYVEKCPRCGGEIIEKAVKEVIYGGTDTAIVSVKAGVCLRCGDHLYTPEIVQRFEQIKARLAAQQTTDFHIIGKSFEVVC